MFDPCYSNNFVDANFFDRTGGPEDAAVDEILRLRDEGAFVILLSHSVKEEIEHSNRSAEAKRRAEGCVFTEPVPLTDPEQLAEYNQILALIQGNAKPGQHDKYASHLFEAAREAGQHFITNDEQLLGKADEILGMLHLRVLKPSEFLEAYRQAHPPRDESSGP